MLAISTSETIWLIVLIVTVVLNIIFLIWFIRTLGNINESLVSIDKTNKDINKNTEFTNTILNLIRKKGNDTEQNLEEW